MKLDRTSLAVWLAAIFSMAGRSGGPADTPGHAYREPHRPQFHFTPPAMWMNDPNGMVYYDGEYHLFYQYFPEDKVWGPMHWGHAVSRDLVRWQHLPVALYPDDKGYIFSGSAVVDRDNSSGFGVDGEPPLVAIFTYHDAVRGAAGARNHESQAVAFSNDRGHSWTKYAGNPVLPNPGDLKDFRDPKVFRYEDHWVMALSASDHVQFWASEDLKSWRYLSSFGKEWGAHGGVWECPDLFPMQVGGETKWVLLLNLNPGGPQGGSGTQYFVGDFDGTAFTLDPGFAATLRQQEAVWLDWGRDNYAGVTWSDVPAEDGRRLFMGWMGNWDYAQQVPTDPWRSAMTLPRALQLHKTGTGYRVYSRPVRELERLRAESAAIPAMPIDGKLSLSERVQFPLTTIELSLDVRDPGDGEFGVVLANGVGEEYRIGFDARSNEFFSDRRRAGPSDFAPTFADRVHRAPRELEGESLSLRLFIDVASVELFADGGATVITDTFFPSKPFDRVVLYGSNAEIGPGELSRLERIW